MPIEFSEYGAIQSVVAGAGIGSTAPKVLTSRTIPYGARAIIVRLTMKAIDSVGSDQIRFAIRHNGMLVTPWHKISGIEMIEDPTIWINQEFGPGLFEVLGYNISGTSEAGANAVGVDFDCIASWFGYLSQ